MIKFAFGTLLLLTISVTAQAQFLRLDVTYTNGHIVSGPLTPDLTELPTTVDATFLINGTGAATYTLEDVLQSSLVFGDASWNASDIIDFSTTLEAAGRGLAVIALTYDYAAQDTPTTDGRLAGNFPLEIEGTDVASGQEFHYLYDLSVQTVTLVPEPSVIVLSLVASAFVYVRRSGMVRR